MLEEKIYQGVAVSPGTAMGRAFIWEPEELTIQNVSIEPDQADKESKRFLKAIEQAKRDIRQEKEQVLQELGEDEAGIWTVQLLLLEDPEIIEAVLAGIKQEYKSAEAKLTEVMNAQVQMFKSLDDAYMQERAGDLEDLKKRLLINLLAADKKPGTMPANSILVCPELLPTDVATFDKSKIKGVVTEKGGLTTHAAILVRSLGIPAVFGIRDVTKKVKPGSEIALNGTQGLVICNPTAETKSLYQTRMDQELQQKIEFEKLTKLPAVTLDGYRVELAANIGSIMEAQEAEAKGAEGIGLFRTEFIYLDANELPTEENQFQIYKQVGLTMKNKPVIIRTLDIGGDKKPGWMEIPEEANPFLGYRAIRLCLGQKEMFKTQLKAILRASAFGNLKIMYPFVISVEEVEQANLLLDQVKQELEQQNIAFQQKIQVGIMVETPAASLIVEELLQKVDFVSVGTNDLTQYTLAADRMNEKVANLYDYYHPAVLRQLKMIGEAGEKAGKMVGICGEMASDPLAVKLLLGFGFSELSVNLASINHIKSIIRATSLQEAREFTAKALELNSPRAVRQYLAQA